MKLYVIYNYKNRYPQLSGHALTDALIRDCLQQDPDLQLGRLLETDDFVVRRTDKGKPFIVFSEEDNPEALRPAAGLHISVSHSAAAFALLVSEVNAGMDIQYFREVNTEGIAARIFTKEEADYAAEDPAGDRFFRLWTRKEAYSKYTGLGMEQIMRKDQVLSREDVAFTDFRLRDGCFCSICTACSVHEEREGGQAPDEIQISYGE